MNSMFKIKKYFFVFICFFIPFELKSKEIAMECNEFNNKNIKEYFYFNNKTGWLFKNGYEEQLDYSGKKNLKYGFNKKKMSKTYFHTYLFITSKTNGRITRYEGRLNKYNGELFWSKRGYNKLLKMDNFVLRALTYECRKIKKSLF